MSEKEWLGVVAEAQELVKLLYRRVGELQERMNVEVEERRKAEAEARRLREASAFAWNKWPDENDGEYPPDEVNVLIRCKDAHGEWFDIRCISRRCGTYGPSFATHWALIPLVDAALAPPAQPEGTAELSYRGLTGSVSYSVKDKVFHGKIEGIRSLVTYESDTGEGLEQEFRAAVDGYSEEDTAEAGEDK